MSFHGFQSSPGTPTIASLCKMSSNSLSLSPARLQEASTAAALSFFSSVFSLRLRAPPAFPQSLGRGSFRTIDPVTTPRRNWVQDGSLLLFSRAPRGGAISRRRYPSARLGHFRRRFRPYHLPRTEFRAARTAQALPLGNPLPVSDTHRRKTRLRRFRKRRLLYRWSQICPGSSASLPFISKLSKGWRPLSSAQRNANLLVE